MKRQAAEQLSLEELAAEIRRIEERTRAGQSNVIEDRFVLGHRLVAARQLLRDDQSYGRWLRKQAFDFNSDWALVLRRAAANEEAVRKALADQGGDPNFKEAVAVACAASRKKPRPVDSQESTAAAVLPATIRVERRDARDLWPGDEADLAIFSPPYPDAGITYDGQDKPIGLADWCELIGVAAKVLADGWNVARVCMVIPAGTGRTPYRPLAGLAWSALEAAGFAAEGEIVWDKATTGNRTTWGSWRLPTEPRLRDRHELVLVARSPHEHRISADAFVDDGDGRLVSPWLSTELFTDLTQSVWSIQPDASTRRGHPAPFPPALVERLLCLYGWPGCTVVDPFAGSGTVGEVAVKLGASAILGDQSDAYCALMRDRLGIHVVETAKPATR